MTIHEHSGETGDDGRNALSHAAPVSVTLATSRDDYRATAELMRAAATALDAPLPADRVGQTLERLGREGGGPDVGGLLVARAAHGIAGFALLSSKLNGDIELSWLHAESDGRDGTLEALWAAVKRTWAEWGTAGMWVAASVPHMD